MMAALARMPWRAIIGFELCWFALVWYQQLAIWPVVLYLGYGLWQLNSKARTAVCIIFALGVSLDWLLVQAGVLWFSGPTALPLWFVAIWAVFALAAVEFMAACLKQPALALVLGAIGGPLSYWGGSALSGGMLQFPLGAMSIMVLVVVWALLALLLGQSRRWYVKAL